MVRKQFKEKGLSPVDSLFKCGPYRASLPAWHGKC